MHTYSTYSYMIFAISVQAILIWNSFLSIDQSTFKGGLIRGQTTRLTDEVKVTKLLPQWKGLDKIVYYSATTTNRSKHLYQIWTKNYIISGIRRLTKEIIIFFCGKQRNLASFLSFPHTTVILLVWRTRICILVLKTFILPLETSILLLESFNLFLNSLILILKSFILVLKTFKRILLLSCTLQGGTLLLSCKLWESKSIPLCIVNLTT